MTDGRNRKDIRPGSEVSTILKQDQRTGKLTRGVVKDILTKSATPHMVSRFASWMGKSAGFIKSRTRETSRHVMHPK
jgi:uncharacterized repeat protein (TIGR03833 family)